MDTLEYLQALYNGLSSGALSVTAKVGASMLTKWFSPDQLEQMALFAQKCGTKYNTYIGISFSMQTYTISMTVREAPKGSKLLLGQIS